MQGDEASLRSSFSRFENDALNGFSNEKLERLGSVAVVVMVYNDRTVTVTFSDGVSFDCPFETIAEQLSVASLVNMDGQGWSEVIIEDEDCSICLQPLGKAVRTPCHHAFHRPCLTAWCTNNLTCPKCRTQLRLLPPMRVNQVALGCVRLLDDETAFRDSFTRFEGCPLNGFSESKARLRGSEVEVIMVYDDQTISVFADGGVCDVPFETVQEQVSVVSIPIANNIERGRVRLLEDEVDFMRSFHRFGDDTLNGCNEAKVRRRGAEAEVTEVYADATVTCRFGDGVVMDFPMETVAEQLSVPGRRGSDRACS